MFKILDEVCTPTKGTEFSACVDLYAREDVEVGAGETKIVPLGVKIDLEGLKPKFFDYDFDDSNSKESDQLIHDLNNIWEDFLQTHVLKLHIRSSTTLMEKEDKPQYKHLHIANGTGVIDMDYKDEIGIILHKPLTLSDIPAVVVSTVSKYFSKMFLKSGVKSPIISPCTINKGDKIAQIMLCEHKTYLMGYDTQEKRTGGFGSTGN